MGADPAGSRVLEAFLGGSAPAKVKAGLLRALAGRWGAVAATAPGSFLVEAAYRAGVRERGSKRGGAEQLPVSLVLLFVIKRAADGWGTGVV